MLLLLNHVLDAFKVLILHNMWTARISVCWICKISI